MSTKTKLFDLGDIFPDMGGQLVSEDVYERIKLNKIDSDRRIEEANKRRSRRISARGKKGRRYPKGKFK